jgi:medium-chain acyl-[acyl-carrier-protein] hydrolase
LVTTLQQQPAGTVEGVAASRAWLGPVRAHSTTQLRLFCFPYAGGGASAYNTWAEHLPHDVEVVPIRLPGREGRFTEAPARDLPALVDALAPALRPHLDVPFAFFGHSMGALIGFELCRRLRRDYGLLPLHLFLSAHRAPHLPNLSPQFHRASDEAILGEVRRLSPTRSDATSDDALMRALLPMLRADWTVCETYGYRPDVPLDCPITVYGASDDTEASYHELVAWRDHTSADFRMRIFPGDHFYVVGARVLVFTALSDDLGRVMCQSARATRRGGAS